MAEYVIRKNDRVFVKKAKGFVPKDSIGLLPENIAKEDWPYLQASQSNDPQTGEPVWNITVDSSAKAIAVAEQSKKDDIAAAYKAMSDEVDAKMYEVFRTLKADYATAEYETWQDMKKRPSAYSGLGLKVDHQINNVDETELFSPGSALDTDQKILDYATRKIELAEAYGTFRVQRIQQFKNEKEQIQNS